MVRRHRFVDHFGFNDFEPIARLEQHVVDLLRRLYRGERPEFRIGRGPFPLLVENVERLAVRVRVESPARITG